MNDLQASDTSSIVENDVYSIRSRSPPSVSMHGTFVLQCVAVRCSVLHVYHSVLQCMAVCCIICCSVLQCVAVCCSVLRCVAVCYSVLLCVAVCCSMV